MKEYLISGLIGALIGYIFCFLVNGIREFIARRIKEKKIYKITGDLNKVNFTNIGGYMPIDHSVPEYKEENIVVNKDSDKLIVSIPKEYREQLRKLNFEIHEENLSDFKERIEQSFHSIGIDNYSEVIRIASIQVAKLFIADIKKGFVRFNGYMFGVNHLSVNRVSIEENSFINFRVYTSDYFTYRVFAFIYQQHKESINITNIASLNEITPFLSSFGIGCFVIANNGEKDFVLLAERSGNVIVDTNKKHFSINEAFSLLDVDNYGNPNFTACLNRGLKEELGIHENYRFNIYQYGFLDLGMDINRLEMGISCYAKLRFDNKFTPKLLKELYSLAQDRELETKELIFIPFDELDKYLIDNKNSFSSGCYATLTSLNTRYKVGLLQDRIIRGS